MEYMSITETAEHLGVTRQTVYLYTKSGQLRRYTTPRTARRSYYSREEVEELKRKRATLV